MRHLLDIPTVALRLGVRSHQVKKMVAAGQIPHVCLPDGTVGFRADDLDEWLALLSRPGSLPTHSHEKGRCHE